MIILHYLHFYMGTECTKNPYKRETQSNLTVEEEEGEVRLTTEIGVM